MTFRRQVPGGIELRQFALEDAVPLFDAVERDRAYLRQWLPWVDHTESVADIRAFIERARTQFTSGLGPNTGIWLDGGLIGAIGCHTIDTANRACSIGYWLAAAQQRRGIISSCCSGLLDYLFDEVKLHRVVIQCGEGNERSCAIPKRLGFTLEGCLRQAEWVNDHWVDLLVWSMLQPDWPPAR